MLALDDIHTMYWESVGNPAGVPVLFLHGGPGGGCSPEHRRFFDPDFFRVVLFDQRGAGASTPLGEVQSNTTQQLIADIELLREYLGIDRWLVFGGSWGSTLGLAYGQAHPQRCSGFLLRGIFLGRPQEIEWFMLWAAADLSRRSGRSSPACCRRQSAATCCAATSSGCSIPIPACTLPMRAPGANTRARARRCCRIRNWCATSPTKRSAWRGWKRITSRIAASSRRTSCCRTWTACNGIRPRSCIRATTWCARSSAPMNWRAPGRSARYTIVPDAGHSVWEPAVRATVVAELERFKSLLG